MGPMWSPLALPIWVPYRLLDTRYKIQDTRYKNLYFTSDTFKQITLAIKAIFRQTYYKANIQQIKISCKRKTF